jgi:hypothetical protein
MANLDNILKQCFKAARDSTAYELILAVQNNSSFEVGDVLTSYIRDEEYDDNDNTVHSKNYFYLNENCAYNGVNDSDWLDDDEDEIDDQDYAKFLNKEKFKVKMRYKVVGKDPELNVIAVSAILPDGKLHRPFVPMNLDISEETPMFFELDKDYEDSLLLGHEFDVKEVYKRELNSLNKVLKLIAEQNKQNCIKIDIEEPDRTQLELTLLKLIKPVKNTKGKIEAYICTGKDDDDFWANATNYVDGIDIYFSVGRTGKVKILLDDILDYADRYHNKDESLIAVWLDQPKDVKDIHENF